MAAQWRHEWHHRYYQSNGREAHCGYRYTDIAERASEVCVGLCLACAREGVETGLSLCKKKHEGYFYDY